MPLALLLLATLAAEPREPSAVDAEREFAAAAQRDGQWTAFLAFAADGATMFVPQPVDAADFLADRANPPVAVRWWPAASFVSCDGKLAVNTGPWQRPDSVGYFTTVWRRQVDGGWKWLVDGGDTLATPRPKPGKPRVRRAACTGTPPVIDAPEAAASDAGASPDGTLQWRWTVAPDGARSFDALLWNGKAFEAVVADRIAAAQ